MYNDLESILTQDNYDRNVNADIINYFNPNVSKTREGKPGYTLYCSGTGVELFGVFTEEEGRRKVKLTPAQTMMFWMLDAIDGITDNLTSVIRTK